MIENPLVSIITPSYNQGRFIEETIQSVLTQDYSHIEHIVIDGGSTDNTLDILKKYGDKITWISEKDKGQTDAINKGFIRAKGEILAWLNSDDTYLPGAIRKAVNYFKANPGIKIMHGTGYYTNADGSISRPFHSDPKAKESLPEAFHVCQPCLFICREVIDNIGLVDTDLHYCMDYDLVIRISQQYDIGYLSEYLATYRLYEGNKSSDYQKMFAEFLTVQRKYFGMVSFNYIYSYARKLLQSKLRREKFIIQRPGLILRFAAMLYALYKFTRLNRKPPVAGFIRWFNIHSRLAKIWASSYSH